MTDTTPTRPATPGGPRKTYAPIDWVTVIGRLYGDFWTRCDRLRAENLGPEPAWPTHHYLPYRLAWTVLEPFLSTTDEAWKQKVEIKASTLNTMIGLAAWRVTQGIYCFDPALFDALCNTPVSGQLPRELLYHLPEWCVYMCTPGLRWGGEQIDGVFAQVTDTAYDEELLGLSIQTGSTLHSVFLSLETPSLEDAIKKMYEDNAEPGRSFIEPNEEDQNVLTSIVSLLLYLCSEAAEIGDGNGAPVKPTPRKTKKGIRMFPAERATKWDVGLRLGAALREAWREAEGDGQDRDARVGPRPHIRRAHWHTFLSGSRNAPRRSLRWLPPIPVNVGNSDDLVPTVRPVGKR